MKTWLRRMRLFFQGGRGDAAQCPGSLLQRQTHAYLSCVSVLHGFYVFQFIDSLWLMTEWHGILGRKSPEPLWPVAWITAVSSQYLSAAVLALLAFYFCSSFAAMLQPASRILRALAFIGLTSWVAYNNSFGKIGHSMHLMVYVGFLLIWLPVGWNSRNAARAVRQHVLMIHWTCVATILLTYSLAGLIKIWVGLAQLAMGQISVFHSDALARQVADRLLQTGEQSLCGDWIIAYAPYSFLVMLPTVGLEIIAFWAAFRPRWRLPVAGLLLCFHAASFLTMTILFKHACVMLALFCCIPLSPNSPKKR